MLPVLPQKRFHPRKAPPSIDRTPHISMVGVLPFTYALEFTLFLTLPSELRLKIWDDILDEPRIIEIGLTAGDSSFDHFFTRTKLPAPFQVCRESRERAFQKHVTLIMPHTPRDVGGPVPWDVRDEELKVPRIGVREPDPLRLLINYDVDILYLSIKSCNIQESSWGPEELWHRGIGMEHFLWHLTDTENAGKTKLRRIAFEGEAHLSNMSGPPLSIYEKLQTVYLLFEDKTKRLTSENVPIDIQAVRRRDDRLAAWGREALRFQWAVEGRARSLYGANTSLEAFNSVRIIPAFLRRQRAVER